MTPINSFQQTVWGYYSDNRRQMPWRLPEPDGAFDIYKILISEIMLQQTQVSRVIEKYALFITSFPNIGALADASLADVLIVWQGLGYNRRAKYLHDAAKHFISNTLPWKYDDLVGCRGIGRPLQVRMWRSSTSPVTCTCTRSTDEST